MREPGVVSSRGDKESPKYRRLYKRGLVILGDMRAWMAVRGIKHLVRRRTFPSGAVVVTSSHGVDLVEVDVFPQEEPEKVNYYMEHGGWDKGWTPDLPWFCNPQYYTPEQCEEYQAGFLLPARHFRGEDILATSLFLNDNFDSIKLETNTDPAGADYFPTKAGEIAQGEGCESKIPFSERWIRKGLGRLSGKLRLFGQAKFGKLESELTTEAVFGIGRIRCPNGVLLRNDWEETTGLYSTTEWDYFIVSITETRITVYKTISGELAKKLKQWLLVYGGDSSKTFQASRTIQMAETYLLGDLTVGEELCFLEHNFEAYNGWGSPGQYGWKVSWSGKRFGVVLRQTWNSGSQMRASFHEFEIKISELAGEYSVSVVAEGKDYQVFRPSRANEAIWDEYDFKLYPWDIKFLDPDAPAISTPAKHIPVYCAGYDGESPKVIRLDQNRYDDQETGPFLIHQGIPLIENFLMPDALIVCSYGGEVLNTSFEYTKRNNSSVWHVGDFEIKAIETWDLCGGEGWRMVIEGSKAGPNEWQISAGSLGQGDPSGLGGPLYCPKPKPTDTTSGWENKHWERIITLTTGTTGYTQGQSAMTSSKVAFIPSSSDCEAFYFLRYVQGSVDIDVAVRLPKDAYLTRSYKVAVYQIDNEANSINKYELSTQSQEGPTVISFRSSGNRYSSSDRSEYHQFNYGNDSSGFDFWFCGMNRKPEKIKSSGFAEGGVSFYDWEQLRWKRKAIEGRQSEAKDFISGMADRGITHKARDYITITSWDDYINHYNEMNKYVDYGLLFNDSPKLSGGSSALGLAFYYQETASGASEVSNPFPKSSDLFIGAI